MIITGIGSRSTPEPLLDLMCRLAFDWSNLGAVIRSGKAGGADAAFQIGAQHTPNPKLEIYVPWGGFNSTDSRLSSKWDIVGGSDTRAAQIAEATHPAWSHCSPGAKKLHTRNVMQILGYDLQTPSDVVLFWCPVSTSGKPTGGTATAINLAGQYGIPCIHLEHQYELLGDWLAEIQASADSNPRYFNACKG